METPSREHGLSGLVAGLGLAALVVALIVMLLLPGIRYAAWSILTLGILLLAIAFIMDFRRVTRTLTGRRGMFGIGTTVMASISVGIILLINAISVGNYHRFDTTGLAQFTLTSQTKDALANLKTQVKVTCFFVPNDPYGIRSYATSLLAEYQNNTDKLSVEFVDPEEHPDRARKYGITQWQTVAFESGNHRRLVLPYEILEQAEHSFTSAILEVTGTVQKKVYFLTGHGETSISGDYSYARQGLLDNLYRVGTLDLIANPSIPEDIAALIIVAPRRALTGGEFELIKQYLRAGGWVLFLLNPDSPEDMKQLLSAWGVDVQKGTLIDPASYAAPSVSSPTVPSARDLFQLPVVYFPEATSITPQPKVPKSIELRPLAWTTKESWLENNFDPNKPPVFDEGADTKGPFALAVLITTALPEKPEEQTAAFKDTRIIAIGDSDFASNQHFYNGNNGEFFLNAVNLLTAGKELISIERKVLPFRRLVASQEVVNVIRYSSIGLLPVLVLVAGGIVWWRRR